MALDATNHRPLHFKPKIRSIFNRQNATTTQQIYAKYSYLVCSQMLTKGQLMIEEDSTDLWTFWLPQL